MSIAKTVACVSMIGAAVFNYALPAYASASSAPVKNTSYIVRPHDTLWKIAKEKEIPMGDLISWNHLRHPNLIKPGERLEMHAVSKSIPRRVTRAVANVRESIVHYAESFKGTPYVWGGVSRSGFDCSGFVQTVYTHFDVKLPRTAAQQAQVGSVVPVRRLEPGDLVFFNTTGQPFSHTGIYVGNGQFISATSSKGVAVRELLNPYYWGPRLTRATNPLSS